MSLLPGDDPSYPSLKRSWPFGDENELPSLTESTKVPDSRQTSSISDSEPVENICFGTIIDVKAQLCRVDGVDQHHQSYGTVQAFPVVQEGEYLALESAGNEFARLNKTLCANLRALINQCEVHLQAYVLTKELATTMRSRSNNTLVTLPLEINIYGLRSIAEVVGSILSKCGIFLQAPYHGLENTTYYNPQLLRLGGFSDQVEVKMEKAPPPAGPVTLTQRRNEDEELQPNESGVDQILNSLSHHAPLQEISVDSRIKSELLPHQKEAIGFIQRREIDDADSSLWEYNDKEGGEPFYRHVFSGAKRPRREEAKGGILGDEMGLGKSLVILSTIASSLERSQQFVNTENQVPLLQPKAKVPSGATLILAPSSLLIDNWADEIHKHTFSGALTVHRHLGLTRHAETDRLRGSMIVFTTYATVAADFRNEDSALAKINWFRIVLDEAHDIRNRDTRQFQAVASLAAQHRWCLSGTIIQNSLDDLGSLVSFLKVPILESAPTFRKFITNPIAANSKGCFQNLRALLQTICLRRTRDLLHLPEPVVKDRRIDLSPKEQVDYRNLVQGCRREIDMAVCGYGNGKRRINSIVLRSLLKLRLFCNNGNASQLLQTDSTGLPTDLDETLSLLQQAEQNICAYCAKVIYSINSIPETNGGIFMKCRHLICRNCTPHRRAQKERCPGCAEGAESILTTTASLNDPLSQIFQRQKLSSHDAQYPSKLLALLVDIKQDSKHKSIVFSFWKTTLKLVGSLLGRHAIKSSMIDGSLSLAERIKVLKDFQSPTGTDILLMTLGTGAVGLNLAVASRIYLLEPQWNPSIESQAIGRALRLGQTAQVVVVRYIMNETVEQSNVLSRQRTKLQLAGGGFKDASSERLKSMMNVFDLSLPESSS